MDYFEFFSWSQRWFMDNFPPLPLVKYESPCYDPYEIDPSHYSDFNNLDYYPYDNHYDLYSQYCNTLDYNNRFYNQHYSQYESEYESESESSESDLEQQDPHDFN